MTKDLSCNVALIETRVSNSKFHIQRKEEEEKKICSDSVEWKKEKCKNAKKREACNNLAS